MQKISAIAERLLEAGRFATLAKWLDVQGAVARLIGRYEEAPSAYQGSGRGRRERCGSKIGVELCCSDE